MWCWELNLCPQEEQPVLLTTEPSLQALNYIYIFWKGNFTTLLSLVWTSIELNSMPKLPPALCNYISFIVSALGKSRPHRQFFTREKVGLGRRLLWFLFQGATFGSQHPPQAAHNQLQLQRPHFRPLQAPILTCTHHSLSHAWLGLACFERSQFLIVARIPCMWEKSCYFQDSL